VSNISLLNLSLLFRDQRNNAQKSCPQTLSGPASNDSVGRDIFLLCSMSLESEELPQTNPIQNTFQTIIPLIQHLMALYRYFELVFRLSAQ